MKKVNARFYLHNPKYFPWAALKLDPPLYGPMYISMLKVLSTFKEYAELAQFITATPTEMRKHKDNVAIKAILESAALEGINGMPKDEFVIYRLHVEFPPLADILSKYLTDLKNRGLFYCPPDLWIDDKSSSDHYRWGD